MRFTNLERVLKSYANDLEKLLKAGVPVATGTLKKSIQCDMKRFGSNYTVVVNLEDYYYWIENGRGKTQKNSPHFDDDKLREWIISKKISFKDSVSSSKRSLPSSNRVTSVKPKKSVRGKSMNNTDIDQLIFLIKRKIHQEGYNAKPFIDNVVDSLNNRFQGDIERALQKDVETITLNAIKKFTI